MGTLAWCDFMVAILNGKSPIFVTSKQEHGLCPSALCYPFVVWRSQSRIATKCGGKRSAVISRSAKQQQETGERWNYKAYEALLRGGEEVSSLMKEMTELLDDFSDLDAEAETAALQMAAAAAVGQRIDRLDGSFLVSLDWMINQADNERNEQRKSLLEIIKDTVLAQLTEKCPGQVQVIGILCRTPRKEHRLEILRRSAGGGGVFDTESGGKLALPAANLDDIASQADDILRTMEEKPKVSDRKLLSKLVLVREEARSMMGGGILDTRNDNRGLKSLPECEVGFLSKVISLRPGLALRQRLSNVMHGKEEGMDLPSEDDNLEKKASFGRQPGRKGRNHVQPLPVRPGMFLETLTKVLGGMYETKVAGVTVQHLEWIRRETLQILEEMAYS